MVAKNEVTPLQRTLWILNTFFNQLLAVVTAFVMWVVIKNNKVDYMFWHALLSTLAYIPLMAIAIVLFASDNQWSQYILRTKKQWIHGVLLVCSAVAVSVGVGLEVHHKTSDHFKSRHAKYGLASWVLMLVSVIFGVFANYSQMLRALLPPVWIKFCHNLVGLAAFATGIVSLWYGFGYGAFGRFVTEEELRATRWIAIACAAWSCKSAFVSLYEQLKSIFAR